MKNVELRIMPTRVAVHDGLDDEFTLLDFDAAQGIGYLELAAACVNAPHIIAGAPAITRHSDGSVTLTGSAVILRYTAGEWGAFIAGARDGEFAAA
ncbi:Scr1 family TA system antitoxin-like transcriptional regulator [Nocardia sp. NPDC059180]|uniref:Scr1 family TA system antitoxin-like transcriptional regulator n=1 Tax=Nocardia sp. NPDC059180 TaxID=3346761 RepID=UPI0036821622